MERYCMVLLRDEAKFLKSKTPNWVQWWLPGGGGNTERPSKGHKDIRIDLMILYSIIETKKVVLTHFHTQKK